MLSATETNYGVNERTGFENIRYDYRLTEDGKAIARKKAEDHAEIWAQIEAIHEKIEAAGDLDYMKLSIAAKAVFLLRQKGKACTAEDLASEARKLDWDPSPDEIRESMKSLSELGLVKAS